MKTHLCPTYLCAVVVAASVSCAAAGSAPPAFRLTTSLDGLKVLPHRIQWVARTNVPTSTHLKVEFFVDGGVARWAERDIPYTFSDDDGMRGEGRAVKVYVIIPARRGDRRR